MTDNTSVMNVDGASVSEAKLAANETRDIVLPNQTEHVAHIAIDVRSLNLCMTRIPLDHFALIDWRFVSKDCLLYFFFNR